MSPMLVSRTTESELDMFESAAMALTLALALGAESRQASITASFDSRVVGSGLDLTSTIVSESLAGCDARSSTTSRKCFGYRQDTMIELSGLFRLKGLVSIPTYSRQ